jgi:hypothetical protein
MRWANSGVEALTRPVVQRLESNVEGCGEGGHIGLLADGAAGDQDTVSAHAGFGGTQFRQGQHAGRQEVADAVDFRTTGEPGTGPR